MRRLARAAVAWGCIVGSLGVCAEAAGPDRARVDRSIGAATAFLRKQLKTDGSCVSEYPADNVRHGGRTALVVQALLATGADPRDDQQLGKSLEWLAGRKLAGVYAVSARTLAMAELLRWGDRLSEKMAAAAGKRISADVGWLLGAANEDGSYGYHAQADRPAGEPTYDNSNSHLAVLAVYRGSQAIGMPVPPKFWQLVRDHWAGDQQPDGGWGYRVLDFRKRTRSYGSMTAAGLATLHLCRDRLDREQIIRCQPRNDDKAIQAAQDWLAKRFDARTNPGKNVEWHFYWLYSVSRVGRISGQRRIGQADWYEQGASRLVAMQNEDGSFWYGPRVEQTCLAVLFLARGREPTLVHKLRFKGRWEPRPRDLAEWTAWMSSTFERPVGWKVLDAGAELDQWRRAPILYVSGHGTAEFSEETIDRLRAYVHQGGLVVSESACNSAEFTLDVQRLWRKLWPDLKPGPLDSEHPAYTMQYPLDASGLLAVENGVRVLAIHSPRELSRDLHLGPDEKRLGPYRLLANLTLHAVDVEALQRGRAWAWPDARVARPVRTLKLARLRLGDRSEPEPLALPRLAGHLAQRRRIRLELSEPLTPGKLSAAQWPVAYLAGTEASELSAEDRASLKRYVGNGGVILAEAGGASEAFAQFVRKELFPLAGAARGRAIARDDAIFTKGIEPIKSVTYRSQFATTLGSGKDRLILDSAYRNNRPAVVLSPVDLSGGLVGYYRHDLAGYAPESARAIVANLVDWANRTAIPAPASQPATAPADK